MLLFLANFRAAMIPVAAVPVSLVGSFAVMYLLGLLAEQPVADGADRRHRPGRRRRHRRAREHLAPRREGMPPMEAALIGASEVGSTLLSMNLAIVAVFVSLLFMGGIVEQLFREFSITLVGGDPDLAGRLADADADAVRALAAGRRTPTDRAAGSGRTDAGSARCCAATSRTLVWSLRARAAGRCCLLLGVMAFNVHLYIDAPKSFLPKQDTGQLGGFIRGDDGMSFQMMQPKIEAFRQAVLRDPAVESVAGFIGGGRGINNAQMFVRLKPLEERKVSAQKSSNGSARRCRSAWRAPVAQRRSGHPFRRRGRRRRVQYTLRADNVASCCGWGAARARGARRLPELTGIEDELVSSQQITLDVDREAARAARRRDGHGRRRR